MLQNTFTKLPNKMDDETEYKFALDFQHFFERYKPKDFETFEALWKQKNENASKALKIEEREQDPPLVINLFFLMNFATTTPSNQAQVSNIEQLWKLLLVCKENLEALQSLRLDRETRKSKFDITQNGLDVIEGMLQNVSPSDKLSLVQGTLHLLKAQLLFAENQSEAENLLSQAITELNTNHVHGAAAQLMVAYVLKVLHSKGSDERHRAVEEVLKLDKHVTYLGNAKLAQVYFDLFKRAPDILLLERALDLASLTLANEHSYHTFIKALKYYLEELLKLFRENSEKAIQFMEKEKTYFELAKNNWIFQERTIMGPLTIRHFEIRLKYLQYLFCEVPQSIDSDLKELIGMLEEYTSSYRSPKVFLIKGECYELQAFQDPTLWTTTVQSYYQTNEIIHICSTVPFYQAKLAEAMFRTFSQCAEQNVRMISLLNRSLQLFFKSLDMAIAPEDYRGAIFDSLPFFSLKPEITKETIQAFADALLAFLDQLPEPKFGIQEAESFVDLMGKLKKNNLIPSNTQYQSIMYVAFRYLSHHSPVDQKKKWQQKNGTMYTS
mmetsp:Transcript_19908/g.27815  ORF Transcript_19908/g.27815 Transcript_19908/m.27815 type:complete len:553 (-) Transcript_19908:62-1720(-)